MSALCAETEPESSSRTTGQVWKTRETWDEEQNYLLLRLLTISTKVLFIASHVFRERNVNAAAILDPCPPSVAPPR